MVRGFCDYCQPSYVLYFLLMSKTLVAFVLAGALLLIVIGFGVFRSGKQEQPASGGSVAVTVPSGATEPVSGAVVSFSTPKKSAHFESSTPAHGTTLAAPPVNVVIDVNFDLTGGSSISVMGGGKEYGVGDTTIDTGTLAMRRAVDPAAPDGIYTVAYTACWPDGSCHDGHFQFAISRSQRSSYQDSTTERAVTVHLKDIAFAPAEIRIRRGTTVKWVNDDLVEHYVNTDAHPSHTYHQAQNSRVLRAGETFQLAFARPGVYPYHCSAHADVMRGVLIVE